MLVLYLQSQKKINNTKKAKKKHDKNTKLAKNLLSSSNR